MADRTRTWSLRVRLAWALVAGALVMIIAMAVEGTAIGSMRDRQDLITGPLFEAVVEADRGRVALLDFESAVRSYALTGSAVARETLQRLGTDPGGVEVGPLLEEAYGADHPLLLARAEVTAAASEWYQQHAQPIVALVDEQGTAAVSPQQLEESSRAFQRLDAMVAEYSELVLAERADSLLELEYWQDVVSVTLAVLLAAALAIGCLFWVFLRRWVTEPLAELADDARRVAAGEIEHPVAVVGLGEVAQVAQDVEEMRAQLAELLHQAELARAEVTASHAALESQAAELRRSNRDLEQFAYVASHDLQEPLRKVASFTELLESRYADRLDDRGHEYIRYAVDGARRMQRLIGDLLGFSRVGRVVGKREQVDLAAVLEDALADLQTVVEGTAAQVTASDLPVVRGERALLVQLFANLVGNALKFRHPDRAPQVRITTERVADFWQFECQDNGIGIDPEHVDRVFVIFQRLHPKDAYGGTGIGLALCKRIVEYHGGDIWIDPSTSEGTTVRWTLPVVESVRIPVTKEMPGA